MRGLSLIIGALLLAGHAAPPARGVGPQERPPAFVAGVLRADGIVAPFAAFDGRRWQSRWPAGVGDIDLPISLDDVPERWWVVKPPPRTMTVWRDGRTRGTITLGDPIITRPMCQLRVGLKSDYKPETPPPPPFERPYPKDGLVVSENVQLEPIASVENGSAEWNEVLALITDDFNRRETDAARAFTSWVHPYDERERRARPITMEALYRAPTGDSEWTTYYVEAVREYPPGPKDEDDCGLTTFVQGWVMVGPKNQKRLRLSGDVAYCDRKGAMYMLPLALFRADGRAYWIYQFSGFDEEWYGVAEARRGNLTAHIAYPAGVCGRDR
jgi:hypothetical protein